MDPVSVYALLPDASRKFAYTVSANLGGCYDGRLRSFIDTIRYSPIPQASFALDYTRNLASSLGMEQQNRITELITPNIWLALNPRLQLVGFHQKKYRG